MKKKLLVWACCLLVMGGVAFAAVSSVFDQLAIAEAAARESIFDNFTEGGLSFPRSKVVKGLATGKRAGVVKELGDYMRQYTNSPQFIAAYKSLREKKKPRFEDKTAKVNKRIAETKAEIAETEKELKTATGDSKKLFELTLKVQKDMLKELNDPNSIQYNNLMMTGSMSKEEYEVAIVEYERDYPADPKVLIKRRLQAFLDLTADINFDAKLEKGFSGGYVFADEELEAKSDLWKRCFRSGKETITAARAYAQQWLKELK